MVHVEFEPEWFVFKVLTITEHAFVPSLYDHYTETIFHFRTLFFLSMSSLLYVCILTT